MMGLWEYGFMSLWVFGCMGLRCHEIQNVRSPLWLLLLLLSVDLAGDDVGELDVSPRTALVCLERISGVLLVWVKEIGGGWVRGGYRNGMECRFVSD